MEEKYELYPLVTTMARLGIWEQDLRSGRQHWNQTLIEIIEGEPGGTYNFEQLAELHKNPGSVRALLQRAERSGRPEMMVSQFTGLKGSSKWVRLRVQTFVQSGRCVRRYGTLEDITKQVRMVSKLQGRDVRFATTFLHAPNGMAMVNLDGRFTKVNRSLCRMLGRDKKEFLTTQFQELTHPEDLTALHDHISSLVEGRAESFSLEVRYLHAQGHYLWSLLNVSIAHDESGKPFYLIFQIKDISERISNLKTINTQNKRLKNFAHIVSHNLRSYGGNIRTLAQMAHEETDLGEKDRLISMLQLSAERLMETLDDLNEVVKAQSDAPLDQRPIMLYKEVQRVTEILSTAIAQAGAHISLQISMDEQIDFNPAYFESIVLNLLSNAIKYRHPERQLYLDIATYSNESQTTMTVRDNGLGIDLSLHGESLFGMHKTFHNHPDSRGIGLFLVKQQIEQSGGSITVDSVVGQGTCFTLRFPRTQGASTPSLHTSLSLPVQ